MIQRRTFAIGISIVLFIGHPAAGQSPTPRARFNRAIERYNTGEYRQAADILADLEKHHPDYYSAYSLFWDSLSRLDGEEAVQAAVRRAAARFKDVSTDERTEDFYYAYLKAADRLGDGPMGASLKQEAIKRLPRSKIAQSAMLDTAREADDPGKSAMLFQKYIGEFSDNTSWTEIAAREKFFVMSKHTDRFSTDELVAAAEQHIKHLEAAVAKFGNPAQQLMAYCSICTTLLKTTPSGSLQFADRAIDYIRRVAPTTSEFEESAAVMFRMVKLMAHARLEMWSEARNDAEACGLASSAAVALWCSPSATIDEAELRGVYATALTKTGALDAAREQLAYAATLDSDRKAALDAHLADHPATQGQQRTLDKKVAEFVREREEKRRTRLLAGQQRRPAPTFELEDLAGETVSLEDFRGKVVVLDFWATWCGACVLGLDDLSQAYDEKYAKNPKVEFVAISTDTDRSKVVPFVKKAGYKFRVLYTDGTVEKPYEAATKIPQLYVIDPEGNIRFHKTGSLVKHFRQHLDWMIEAAGK